MTRRLCATVLTFCIIGLCLSLDSCASVIGDCNNVGNNDHISSTCPPVQGPSGNDGAGLELVKCTNVAIADGQGIDINANCPQSSSNNSSDDSDLGYDANDGDDSQLDTGAYLGILQAGTPTYKGCTQSSVVWSSGDPALNGDVVAPGSVFCFKSDNFVAGFIITKDTQTDGVYYIDVNFTVWKA